MVNNEANMANTSDKMANIAKIDGLATNKANDEANIANDEAKIKIPSDARCKNVRDLTIRLLKIPASDCRSGLKDPVDDNPVGSHNVEDPVDNNPVGSQNQKRTTKLREDSNVNVDGNEKEVRSSEVNTDDIMAANDGSTNDQNKTVRLLTVAVSDRRSGVQDRRDDYPAGRKQACENERRIGGYVFWHSETEVCAPEHRSVRLSGDSQAAKNACLTWPDKDNGSPLEYRSAL
jgi:hypothetical protein